MKKNKKLISSKTPHKELKIATEDIGKNKRKVAKTTDELNTKSKESEQIASKLSKGLAKLKKSVKKNKKLISSNLSYKKLKTVAKDIGKNKRKVAKTSQDLKTTIKKKRGVKEKVKKTAGKLKIIAKDIGKNKLKVSNTAEELKTTSKESEQIASKLSRGLAKLKTSVKKKEEKRFKLIEIAKQLAKTADIKEVVRVRMAKKAELLRKTASEKEKTRLQLAKTAAIIKELSDRNEAILSSIGDAAFATDKQGNIILFNKMAEEITGLAKKDALGKHYNKVTNFINEITGKPSPDFILEAIVKKKKTKMELQTLLVRKDGKKIPVADTAAPIFDSSGEVTGCVVVFRDVTKERSVDRAKTELVSLSSHQLRSPLTAIGWFVELLQSKTNGVLTDKQLKLTREIQDAHKRMTALVNSFLNVSRIEMGTYAVEPKPTDIVMVVKTTLELFKHLIDEKHIALKENYDKNINNFHADPKILGVIFQNLISNAVKYNSVGGKIEIKIKKQNSLEISVSDSGVGIPKHQQSNVFTKFFRAANAYTVDPDGTGLGLYIVHEIVSASGGSIRFKSDVGKGTTFYVSYPLKGMSKKKGDKSIT